MLLVTAFQPFDGSGLNSAQEALRAALPSLGSDVVVAEPPVVWGQDIRMVWPLVDRHRPEAILLLGQGGGAAVRLEALGRNQRWVGRDPARLRPILPDAPATFAATAPVGPLVAALRAAGLPARLSDDAGSYLCNHLYFHVLHRLNRHGWRIPTVFVHLPLLPVQAARREPPAESLAAEVSERAVCLVAAGLVVRLADAVRPSPP